MNFPQKFCVIGLGPIGSILSAHLIKNKHNVILVEVIEERISEIKQKGLKIKDEKNCIIGNFTVYPEKFENSVKKVKEKIDVFFICVKTYALDNVIKEIKEIREPNSKVVSFQNGLGNEELLAQSFGKENVLRVVVNYAGSMLSHNEVKVTFFNKPNYIGAMEEKSNEIAKKIAEILTKSGLDTEFTTEIKKYEWEKTILNAALSPVCAVTGLTMKEAMDNSYIREIVENIIKEGINVAEKTGIKFPENFFEFCISYLEKGGYHKPSMLIDIEAGRKTEIDFLNKKIVEYGEKCGVNVVFNKIITFLIKGIESRRKNRK